MQCASVHSLFAQISQQKTHIQAYIRTQKRTRSYTEEDLHGIKCPIDRPTNTPADTATASAEASSDAPYALINAPEEAAATNTASVTLLFRRHTQLLIPLPLPIWLPRLLLLKRPPTFPITLPLTPPPTLPLKLPLLLTLTSR